MAIRRNPNAEAYDNRGTAWGFQGDHHQALIDLSEAIRRYPLSPDYYCNRGISYLRSGEYTNAISDFSEAIKLRGTNYAKAYYQRSLARSRIGDHEGANSDLAEVDRIRKRAPMPPITSSR